jgi:hypothetical protein
MEKVKYMDGKIRCQSPKTPKMVLDELSAFAAEDIADDEADKGAEKA